MRKVELRMNEEYKYITKKISRNKYTKKTFKTAKKKQRKTKTMSEKAKI